MERQSSDLALRIGLVCEAFDVCADFPLSPAFQWWQKLTERNANARAVDRGIQTVLQNPPRIEVRIKCPGCGAGIHLLTVVEEDGSYVRVCRNCDCRFEAYDDGKT